MIISSTGVIYWDMYFILKLLPMAGEWVVVDISADTRNWHVIKYMEHYRHIQVESTDMAITEIASTTHGVKFYAYLVRIGYGTKETEEYGKKVIATLEEQYKVR